VGRHRKGNGKRKKALGLTDVWRTCVACRKRHLAGDLLRFVRADDGQMGLDLGRAMPGRGAWLCASRACLKQAYDRNAFSRAFDGPIVSKLEEMDESITRILKEAVKSQLGLAYRAGQLLAGRETVFSGLKSGEVSFLICAQDLSERSIKEVQKVVGEKPVFSGIGLQQAEMGLAIGRGVTGVLGLVGLDFQKSLPNASNLLQKWMGWSHPIDMDSELLGTLRPDNGLTPQASGGDCPQQRSV